MKQTADRLDEVYSQALEEELRGLERRREHDPNLTPEDLQGVLDHLYISDGNNWEGRGPLADTVVAATIAAYERFIADWKS